MSAFQNVRLLALVLVLTGVCVGAEDDKKDDKAKEQAFVNKLLETNQMTTLAGKLAVSEEEDAKKALKVAATLTTSDNIYPVIILSDDQYDSLKQYDNQTVNLVGHLTDKPNVGKVIYYDHLEIAAALAPAKKKRGGL